MVELLRLVLTPERQSIPVIYKQLRWTHKQLEQVINEYWEVLGVAGIHVHVATHAEASGPKRGYIEVDGKLYGGISLDTPA